MNEATIDRIAEGLKLIARGVRVLAEVLEESKEARAEIAGGVQ